MEFAIVTPLIILVLLFAIWFTELIQIKLKVQEAARYVAWEATAYPLHDYAKGDSASPQLFNRMRSSVTQDARRRYANMDSAVEDPATRRLFSAHWIEPFVVMVNQGEQPAPGGMWVNLAANVLGWLVDLVAGLTYRSINPVAEAMIRIGKDYGGAAQARVFGSPEWGFNRQGYVWTMVTSVVTNKWWNRGVGRFYMKPLYVPFTETHAVLADSWRLNSGEDVYGDQYRPGSASDARGTAYWKQLNRMYMVNRRTRAVGDFWVKFYRSLARGVLLLAATFNTPPHLADTDWVQPALVSRNYRNQTSGQVTIVEDEPSRRKYDTTPVCASCSGGDSLKPYGQALEARGKYFDGCRTEMSRGCPSSSLSQDNPFGDYIIR